MNNDKYDKIVDMLLSGYVTDAEKLEIILNLDNKTRNKLKKDKIV